jgi:protein-S-isoprenylcysteine O-methyltransferase Ste14
MYLGILWVLIPPVIAHFSYTRRIAHLLLIAVLIVKVKREGKLLLVHFGTVYNGYTKRSKRMLSFIF